MERLRVRPAGIVLTAVLAAALAVPPTALASPVAAPAFVTPPQPALLAAGCSATLPYKLTHLGDAQQVIVVTNTSWTSTHATLRAYELRNGWDWCKVATLKARIGWSGFAWAAKRKQNTGKTPAGTFGLLWAFGNSANPGTQLRYRSVDGNDWWAYDPKSPSTYNRWLEHGRGTVRASWAEHLKSYGKQYAYSVVLDYNLPTATKNANTKKGGGIFLHVNGSGATAGCVSVTKKGMKRLLRWLDPHSHPVIVMSPKSAITRA